MTAEEQAAKNKAKAFLKDVIAASQKHKLAISVPSEGFQVEPYSDDLMRHLASSYVEIDGQAFYMKERPATPPAAAFFADIPLPEAEKMIVKAAEETARAPAVVVSIVEQGREILDRMVAKQAATKKYCPAFQLMDGERVACELELDHKVGEGLGHIFSRNMGKLSKNQTLADMENIPVVPGSARVPKEFSCGLCNEIFATEAQKNHHIDYGHLKKNVKDLDEPDNGTGVVR